MSSIRSHSFISRFFHNRKEFDEELALYRDATLARILPQLLDANDNADRALTSKSGFPWPPHLVLVCALRTRFESNMTCSPEPGRTA